MKKIFVVGLLLFAVILSVSEGAFCQTLKIMPMGNSITFDMNSYDVPPYVRPDGERISYRYKLYQLLKEEGYDFDFVGSENAGGYYLPQPEYDDNAGFPGITDAQLAYLINTGYNQRAGVQESPGPYLNYYFPDIILLHIGTNDLDPNPSDVSHILDNIRAYDSDVFILVARIINRYAGSDPYYRSLTTEFNDNVQAMVAARHDPKIISVNMETGAGINYSTEMADDLHPTQAGYDKMGIKWFNVIENLNQPPNINDIPAQNTDQGIAFAPLELDTYVSDAEDADNALQWSLTQVPGTHLNASINPSNRILNVSPVDPGWTGSEVIKLKVHDTGSGIKVKSDSVVVTFNVKYTNQPPQITSNPMTSIKVSHAYLYTLMATDPDPADHLQYSYVTKPSWLSFSGSETSGALFGTPGQANLGSNPVKLKVSDGSHDVFQEFSIVVESATPVENNYENSSGTVYPNPTNGICYLKIEQPESVKIRIYNDNGVLVDEFSSGKSDLIRIDMNDLPTGIYMYQAFLGDKIMTGRIVRR
jgi:lysophospholipase L1-like esterase